MDLTKELHTALAASALLLAAGALARGANARANRVFALLCLSVTVWNGAVALRLAHALPGFAWWRVTLFGALLAVAAGLHLATLLTAERGVVRRRLVPLAYASCLLLWLTVFHPVAETHWTEWRLVALVLLASVLALALGVLWRHLRTLAHEPERGAFRLLFGGATVAALGGLSDLVPRDEAALPRIGPAAVLLLLLVVCALVVRAEFFDVDVFLARAVAVVLAAAVATALVLATMQLTGGRPFALFGALLLVVAAGLPLGRMLLDRSPFAPGRPLGEAIAGASARLLAAHDEGGAWEVIEETRRGLPGSPRLAVYAPAQQPLVQRAAGRAPLVVPEARQGEAVLAYLRASAGPTTRSALRRAGAKEADDALRALDALALDLVLPLARGAEPVGWFALGGGRREEYMRPEVATALLTLGHHALASFDRLATQVRERRQASLAALGAVSAALAHELRNPVAAIRGATDVFARTTDPGKTREMLEVIGEESRRLARVLEEFSDYARPSAPRFEAVDVTALVRATVREAELAGFGMPTRIDAAGPVAAVADADQLRRAFANLVRNAREAAGPDGHLTVSVGSAGDRLAVRFEDDGPGLPPGDPAALLAPFHTHKSGGLGLGLALVQRIADAHNGEVRVERLARGAAFTVVLPRRPGTSNASTQPPTHEGERAREGEEAQEERT